MRYTKQIKLAGFGQEGQQRLSEARVLIIGAGGLGCPAITYLAAAGVGHLCIVDHDRVDETNLHRQPLYTAADIGKHKAVLAAEKARQWNPDGEVEYLTEKISPDNALDLISKYDLVLDCTDNYEARYLINDACVLTGKPWIYGAVEAWEGQLAVFNYQDADGNRTATYRCIFPEPSAEALSCNDVGVIGVAPGMVGTAQATEAIKVLTAPVAVLQGLMVMDFMHQRYQEFRIKRNDKAVASITMLQKDYSLSCLTALSEISVDELLISPHIYEIIDIREAHETQAQPFGPARHAIPMDMLLNDKFAFNTENIYVLVCARGMRSAALLQKLAVKYPRSRFLSLSGGVQAWAQVQVEK